MIEHDRKPIRYHLPKDFKLAEPILIERKETATSDWTYQCNAPEDANSPEPLGALLRDAATEQGGYAWRAVTERDELIRVYSVYDLWREMSGRECITLHPRDQFILSVARVRLGLAA